VAHEILQVIAGGKQVAFTDEHHGARMAGSSRAAINASASATYGDGILFLWSIELDR
jgi:hypothetical protein